MPKVMCVLLQCVQLLLCCVFWLRARGNRDSNQPMMRARQTPEEEGTIRSTTETRTPQQRATEWLSRVADEEDDVKDIVMQELMGREDFQNA
jgi:hypothetical protein